MKNRSRAEIASTILKVTDEGEIKTGIMYKASLSYEQLKEYLGTLVKIEMLREEKQRGKRTTFYTTTKGRTFVKKVDELREMLGTTSHIPQKSLLAR